MELPLELGAYIQSFLKPTRPLFETLKHRYPKTWKQICYKHERWLFRNYYNKYLTYKQGNIVTLQGYRGKIRLRHIRATSKQIMLMRASFKRYEDICHELQLPFEIKYCV